ncbi:hypothetical protein L1887_53939 [Cichorium endivia]|nr:hypothetical protein L1887_53939 [Cichorium endivia]
MIGRSNIFRIGKNHVGRCRLCFSRPTLTRRSLPGAISAGLNSVIARSRTRTNRSPILRSSVGALPARPKWFTVVTIAFCFKVKDEHGPSTMVAASIQILIVQSTPDFAAPNQVAHIGSAYRILRGAHVSDEVSRRCICSQSGPACIAVSQFDVPRACHFLQAGASACSSLHATSRRPVCPNDACVSKQIESPRNPRTDAGSSSAMAEPDSVVPHFPAKYTCTGQCRRSSLGQVGLSDAEDEVWTCTSRKRGVGCDGGGALPAIEETASRRSLKH